MTQQFPESQPTQSPNTGYDPFAPVDPAVSFSVKNPQTNEYDPQPVGTVTTVTIAGPMQRMQQKDISDGSPKFWKDGNPMMMTMIPVIQDGEPKRLFLSGDMEKKVGEAVRATGWRHSLGPKAVGGVIKIKYLGKGQAKSPTSRAPRLWAAKFEPPAQSVEGGDPFAQTAPVQTPAPAPQQPATPAPAPAPAPQETPAPVAQTTGGEVVDPPF